MARSGLPSLLLLPTPPEPANYAALGVAYRPAIEMALTRTRRDDGSATLIVAVAVPLLSGPTLESKRFCWPDAQSLLAGLYTIIAVLCEQLHIGTELDGGPSAVDTRIVLLDHERNRYFPSLSPIIEPNNTVLVDLPSFAAAFHPWNNIYYVQSEAGIQFRNLYASFAHTLKVRDEQMVAVGGGPTVHLGMSSGAGSGAASADASGTITPSRIMHIPITLHKTVCLGGTFDYLHLGHKLLLTAGALLLDVPMPFAGPPCEYVIGITGDELLRKKMYAEYVQPWEERARNVIQFLASIVELSRDGWEEKPMGAEIQEQDGDFQATFRNGSILVHCLRIHDAFGPTVEREDITCLVVSGETRSGGRAVNEKRAAQGWLPLETFEVDVLSAEDAVADLTAAEGTASPGEAARVAANFDAKISSTAIRRQRAEAAAAGKAAAKSSVLPPK
ncbi:hypothetical protein SEPCBS119000_002027 [Sporothrix epigloea]|uniref:Cytidyltransferase-like domain-containing protein n=1 Tax=Sporothrix epigloea TaxID=1892477 RepID=A0ABP0DDX1_9PEZI